MVLLKNPKRFMEDFHIPGIEKEKIASWDLQKHPIHKIAYHLGEYCDFEKKVQLDSSKNEYRAKILDGERREINLEFSESYKRERFGCILFEATLKMIYDEGITKKDLGIIRDAIKHSGLRKIISR